VTARRVTANSFSFVFLLSILTLAAPVPVSAQLSKIDEASAELAAKLKARKPRPQLVSVTDFSPADPAILPQAHYLALYLSGSLWLRGKDFLKVDHVDVDKTGIESSPLTSQDMAHLAGKLEGDFLVTGSVEKTQNVYTLKLSVLHLPDASPFDSQIIELKTSEFLESFSAPIQSPNKPGINGLGMPTCKDMRVPSFGRDVLALGIHGVLTMKALVSAQGTVQQIQPTRMLGFPSDEDVYKLVKTWKCEPVHDQSGHLVEIVVPVEITIGGSSGAGTGVSAISRKPNP